MSSTLHENAQTYFQALQDTLCAAIEELDGKARFREDTWEREGGGGGRSRVLEEGGIFEKAGINYSCVHGALPDELAESLPGDDPEFIAAGTSLVIHPRSPMVPTVHMNLRRIERGDGHGWFGGGTDLTPYVLYEDDAVHFHQVLKRACDTAADPGCYLRFKQECDDYFFLPHRAEARGVGGLFFDYLGANPEDTFAFVRAVGDCFQDAYLPIVKRRMNEPYTEWHERFHQQRRGRYVEFNLVYDRGTIFGLKTGGRIESILMSLPPRVRWDYDVSYEHGGFEERLIEVLRSPRNWLEP